MSVCNPILANRARCQLCREGKKKLSELSSSNASAAVRAGRCWLAMGVEKFLEPISLHPNSLSVMTFLSLSFLYLLALWMAHVIYSSSFLSLSSKHLLSYFPLFSSSSSTNLLLVFPSHRPVCLAARSLTTTY